jgi:hypothetical protein
MKKGQEELNREGKGNWVNDAPPEPIRPHFTFIIIIIFLLIVAVGAFYFTTGSDLLTGMREDPAPAEPDVSQNNAGVQAPSHADLQAQDPIPITDGPWRFFGDDSEQNPLYDIKFEPDGTCYVPGDEIVYGGIYTIEGNQITIEIYRRYLAESEDSEGNSRNQIVEWTEWFKMIRVGNTMTGIWEVEGWRFSYDEGLVMTGVRVNGDAIFSRPERPEDPG